MLIHAFGAVLLVAVSLLIGVLGYVGFEGITWHDAFLNTAMILGGMGPVFVPKTVVGKLFVGLFGLYTGLVFAAVIGLVLAPVAHRLLHQFHWDDEVS